MPQDFVQEIFLYTEDEMPLSIFKGWIGMGNECLYLHCHDCMELLYVESGKGSIFVNLQEFPVQQGDFVLVLPGQLHSGSSNYSHKMFCRAIVFDLNQLKEGRIDYLYKNFICKFLTQQITAPTLITSSHLYHPAVANDFSLIYTEFSQKKEAFECFIQSSLLHLLGTLYRNSTKTMGSNFKQKHNYDQIKTVLKYIQEHYPQSISVDEVAALVGYSRYYFMHFFKEVTGLTMVQYLNMVRVDKAAQLLLNSDESITSICSQVGFNNLSYFIRQFSLRYHTTPKRFRK